MGENKGFNSLLIQQYIEGKLDPKQMHELEKQALDDPFLADALEGYAYLNKPVDRQLSILQRQLEERIALQQENKNYFNFSWQRLSIAAAAGLMFITVGILFWMKSPDAPKIAATSKKVDIELTPREVPPQQTGEKDGPSSRVNLASKKPSRVPGTIIALTKIPGLSDVTQSKPSGESLKGTVSDESGQPLTGVSVQVKGTDIATTTDNKGNFTLPDTAKGVVDVSSLGFEKKEIKIDPGNELAVVLKSVINSLDEVVVTANGLSRARKGAVTMSLSTIAGPEPVSGWPKFQEYLSKNTRYPKMETKVMGEVTVGFGINSKGRPENIHIVKSLNSLCDKEAIRLIKAGPDWKAIPGVTSEVRVNVNFHP